MHLVPYTLDFPSAPSHSIYKYVCIDCNIVHIRRHTALVSAILCRNTNAIYDSKIALVEPQ